MSVSLFTEVTKVSLFTEVTRSISLLTEVNKVSQSVYTQVSYSD